MHVHVAFSSGCTDEPGPGAASHGDRVNYDIIGDIHGHAQTLEALLKKLGYAPDGTVWRHPERQVIFMGDFIDGGPCQRATLDIVRPMVENGAALAVMGNHEFNAIAFATDSGLGGHLRPRTSQNRLQHAAFLQEYPEDSAEYTDMIDWFATLPLWLDHGDFRAVHACWDQQHIDRISRHFDGPRLTTRLLQQASTRDHWAYEAVETLLKGKEIPLPEGYHFHDRYGTQRRHIRIRWWSRTERTYRGIFLGSPDWATQIPEDEVQGDHAIDYDRREPPVFLGHYWLSGQPRRLESNVACVDYSVARKPKDSPEHEPRGKLAAYRYNGEKILRNDAFVTVERVENYSRPGITS